MKTPAALLLAFSLLLHTAVAAPGFKTEHLLLYQPDEVLRTRITSAESLAEYYKIETEYYAVSISEQILLSDWYAHYKFFAQQQIDWIEKYRPFRFTDKVPLSLRILVPAIMLAGLGALSYASWRGWICRT